MKLRKFLAMFMLSLTMLFSISSVASAQSTGEAENALYEIIVEGSCMSFDESYDSLDFEEQTYKTSGGYLLWGDLISNEGFNQLINADKFALLTAGAKQDFLKDLMRLCNLALDNSERDMDDGSGISTETINSVTRILQDKAGMGSQLIATLLAETKPDYATATKWYKPFSGPVGTAIAIIVILMMAALGVTIALDIAFITIPAFQLALDGGEDGGGQGGGAKGVAKIISPEARQAVKAVEEGGGGSGQSGSNNKTACGVYLKKRWKGLTLLGICLLYLAQGQIFSFVAWFIDLFSGIIGF